MDRGRARLLSTPAPRSEPAVAVKTHAESAPFCMPAHGRRHKLLASPRKARETRAPGARRLSAGMRAPGVLRRPVHRARHGRQQERRRRQSRFPLSSTRFLHLRHSCICRRSASYCEPGASAAQISPTANNLMSTLDTDHTPRTYHTVTYHTHTGVRLPPKCRPSGWHWGRDAAFGQS